MKPGQVYKAEQVRAVRSEFPLQFGFELNEKFPLRGEVPPAGMSELLEYESLDEIESRRIKAQSYPTSYPVEAFKEECALSGSELSTVLQRAMLDPGAESLRVGLWNFPSLWNALLARREREVSAARGAIIETDIAGKVFEELDFALETRSFVLIEGREGIGKSEAAKNWAARHPGRAIYVRLESGSDEASLFRSIARAVGTASAYNRKASEIRGRVQDTLQPAQLMLVLDEAHFLWPQSARPSRAAPKRVDWVRTALVDFGVPVALLSTPQYFSNACEKFRAIGWNANQIQRRLAPPVALPETPSQASVLAVTRHYFPKASQREIKLVAGAALTSIGFLTTIVHLRRRVDFLKSRHPEGSESEHLKAALAAYIALPEGAQEHGQKPTRARIQAECSTPATPLQGRLKGALSASRMTCTEPELAIN
ncbi:MAG TPA: ATP-binding protein [Opitutaceae bacterium]